MIIFRPQRMFFCESMNEAKEFNNEEDMKDYIVKLWHKDLSNSKKLFTANDIVINKKIKINDDRAGWEDSMYVCLKRFCDKEYLKHGGVPQCIGICATQYKRPN